MSTAEGKETTTAVATDDVEASPATSAPTISLETASDIAPAVTAEAGTSEEQPEVPKKKRGRKPLPPKIQEPVPEGAKRPKGRPRKHKPVVEQTGPKRPRGRPRKYPPKDTTAGPKRARGRPRKSESAGTGEEQSQPKAKKAAGKKGKGTGRGRGRPRKIVVATPDAETTGKRSSGRGRKRKAPLATAAAEGDTPEPEVEVPVAKKPRSKPLKKAIVEAAAAGELSGE